MSVPPANLGGRLPSTVPKREVMWNIIEPGDPYDIRKSMIAKLPGRRNFMGEHLELVCLLQAAEIERLCEYLDEYRLKLREVERRELDRHSYEVQIKELTMRIQDEGNFKSQNLKLREFLRKQSTEFEQLRKHLATSGDETQLLRKYEESLRQAEALINENQQLRDSLRNSRQDYQQALAAKNAEINQLQSRLSQKEAIIGGERGRGETYRLQVQSRKLQFQNKRLKEVVQARARELEEVHGKCKQLIDELEGQSAQVRQLTSLSSTIQQYQSRFILLTEQIERLNKVLRDKTNELSNTNSRLRTIQEERRRQGAYLSELQDRTRQLQEQNRKLQITLKEGGSSAIDESRNIMRTYEGNLEKLSNEITRLNQVLRNKVEDLAAAEQRANEAEQESRRAQGIRREVDEFRSRFSQLNRKMAEYQNRIALTTQEIQRLNTVLRRKVEDNQRLEEQLKARSDALEHSQSAYSQLEIAYNTQNEYLTRYQSRIEQLQGEAQGQTNYAKELDRLNSIIVNQNGQIQRLQSSLFSRDQDSPNKQLASELDSQRQTNYTLRNSLNQYQQRITLLSQQIERLNIVIKKTASSHSEQQIDPRKLTEYQNKLAILSQEIDRLNENLRVKDVKIRTYQQELTQLRRPQQSDINIQQAGRLGDLQQLNSRYVVEIQRLNDFINQQSQNISNLQIKIGTSARESEDLRRQLSHYQQLKEVPPAAQAEIETLRKRLAQQQRRIAEAETITRETESKHRSVLQQTRILEQQVRSYEQLQGQRREGSARYLEYEPKLVALSQEVERLNSILQRLTNQNQDLRRKTSEANNLRDALTALEERLAIAAQENENLRKKFNEGQKSSSRLSQDYEAKLMQANADRQQARRRIQELQNNVQSLSVELQALGKAKRSQFQIRESKFRQIVAQNELLLKKADELTNVNRQKTELETKLKLMSQQIDRLTGILRTKAEQVRALDQKCYKYEIQVTSYQRKVGDLENSTIRQLQAKNASLIRDNDELLLRVRQLTAEGAKVNEFQNKLALTLGEVERLNSVLKAKLDQIDQLGAKQRSQQTDLQRARRRNEELESTMHRQLKNQSAVFEQRITQLSEQNEIFRRNTRGLSDANRRIPQLEHQLSAANVELERLNTILIKYTRETVPALEEKARLLAIQNEQQRRQLADNGKQGAQVNTKLKQISYQNEQLQRRLQDYQNRMGFISSEVQRLNGVLRGKLDDLASAEAMLRQSQAENEQLTKRFKDFSEVTMSIREYQAKLGQVGQEVERLNGVLRSKSEELAAAQSRIRLLEHEQESLQRRLNDQEALTIQLKKHRSGLEEKLTVAGAEKDELRKAVRELSDANRKLSDYQSRLLILSQELERLNNNLKTKTDELAESEVNLRNLKREAENKIGTLSGELQEYRRRASENMSEQALRLAEYQSKMVMMSKEIERLNIVLKETTYEIDNSKTREKQCLQEIERLNNTLRLKVEETTRWEQAHTELKTKLRAGEESLSAAHLEIDKWKLQYSQLTEEHKKSNQHMAEYEKSINKLYQEFERLQSIIQSLKKENYDLKTSLQEAGNLVQKNRVLSAEIDRLVQKIEQQTADLEELRLALADQSALEKRINQYMALMVVLFAQIESLRRRVKDTEKEIQNVRRSSLAPFKV